jgi:hypothetical protein
MRNMFDVAGTNLASWLQHTQNHAEKLAKATHCKAGPHRIGIHNTRVRICKRLWNPEIDSEESIQLAYVAWRAGTTNRVVVPARRLEIDSWAP